MVANSSEQHEQVMTTRRRQIRSYIFASEGANLFYASLRDGTFAWQRRVHPSTA